MRIGLLCSLFLIFLAKITSAKNLEIEYKFYGFTDKGIDSSTWAINAIMLLASLAVLIAFMYSLYHLFKYGYGIITGKDPFNDIVRWKRIGYSLFIELAFMAGLLWTFLEKIYDAKGVMP